MKVKRQFLSRPDGEIRNPNDLSRRKDVIELLVQAGADIFLNDMTGRNALALARTLKPRYLYQR